MLRILLADDHAVVRQGLRRILAEDFPASAFGEAGNGQQVLDLLAGQRWDVVVLDMSMPLKCGLEVLKEIKQHRPAPPVLVLSMHEESSYAVRAFRAGAAGYLSKRTAPEELVAAIHKVLGGGKYVTAAMAETLAGALNADADHPPHEKLADREYQVLCLIASGKTLSGVARELGLSPKTVSTYRARVLEKMSMRTNAELIRYAVENGLVGSL